MIIKNKEIMTYLSLELFISYWAWTLVSLDLDKIYGRHGGTTYRILEIYN